MSLPLALTEDLESSDGNPSDGPVRRNPESAGSSEASSSSAPDRLWTERIRGGDRGAYEALFRALYPSLCSIVDRRVQSPEIAEELVQDLFARVWERRLHLDPEQSITSYLYRSAKNQALNFLKHRKIANEAVGTVVLSLRPAQFSPEDDLCHTELATAAQQAIERLPNRCREIFLLSRQGDLTYAEIASLLGLSVKTVETQMSRALRSLRSDLLPYL
jgi:RNA polymerase sigma-70 factor (family 1)